MNKSICLWGALGFLLIMLQSPLRAQNSHIEVAKLLNYRQSAAPQGTDNYLFSTYCYNGNQVYNLKGFVVAEAAYEIESLKCNPAGTAFALLSRKGDKALVQIFDAQGENTLLRRFREVLSPVSICYSTDSRCFYIADKQGQATVYDSQKYAQADQFQLPFAPSRMLCSPNDYFLVVADDNRVAVVNQETHAVRVSWEHTGRISDIRFSSDGSTLGVLTGGGMLKLYDMHSFSPKKNYQGLGQARNFDFHPAGKYASVQTSDKDVTFLNLVDSADVAHLSSPMGGMGNLRFLQDSKKQVYLTYSTPNAIVYKTLKGVLPNYGRMLAEELNARLNEWSKMRPDETLEAYHERVNEETRLRQAKLFEQEIATELAGDLVVQSVVTLGEYNREKGVLTLGFDNLPQIYLTVPESEVLDFTSPDDLEFRHVVYGLMEDDRFEMTYALVYNKRTGKTYEYDSHKRQESDYMKVEENFVPIDLVQQTSMEDVKLQTIKDDIVKAAMARNLISDHTHIQVSTEAVMDVDADGRKITNYKIRFGYDVEGDYSVQEDFAPGRYVVEQSHAAVSMLEIVTKAFAEDFRQYLKPGKRLHVMLTGSADALKINGRIAYDGCYGAIEGFPYYLNDEMNVMNVTPQTGIRTNEQLAFLRAAGVGEYLKKHIAALGEMKTTYIYNVELAEGTGGQFRRINVEFTFFDAF